MTRRELLKLFQANLINRAELDFQFKEIDNDELMSHGGTFNCRKCTYTRHVNCPPHCDD